MSANNSWEAYLDRPFGQPGYIWRDGICDINAVHDSVSHLPARLAKILPTVKASPEKGISPPESLPVSTTGRPDVTPSRTATIPLKSDVWKGTEPINYHAQIAVGQDPKSFFVDLDTGSSLLWLQSQITQDDAAVDDQTTYVPSKSRTSQDLKRTDTISYGDGSHASASMFADEVTAGKLTAPAQIIGAVATHNLQDAFRGKASNGILGLGFPLTPSESETTNLILTLQAAGQIKYASLSIIGPRNDPKLAAKIDKNATMEPRGFLVIGAVDPTFYTGSISWCPQVVPDRWIVTLDKVVINDDVVFQNQRALIDTGTPYIVASPANYVKVVAKIAGAKNWTQMQNLYFTYPKPSLKRLSFVLGGRTFNTFPQDFSLGGIELYKRNAGAANTSSSQSAASPLTSSTQSEEPPRVVSSVIRLQKWPFDDDLWIIGGIFLDNIVTIFDFGERKIGFADINEEDLELDVDERGSEA